jgi:hypothetical protein
MLTKNALILNLFVYELAGMVLNCNCSYVANLNITLKCKQMQSNAATIVIITPLHRPLKPLHCGCDCNLETLKYL